jgi:hypothetical protein
MSFSQYAELVIFASARSCVNYVTGIIHLSGLFWVVFGRYRATVPGPLLMPLRMALAAREIRPRGLHNPHTRPAPTRVYGVLVPMAWNLP